MKNKFLLLLTFSIFLISSCTKEDVKPKKTTVDFRPNIVGQYSTWAVINYDKDGKEISKDNGTENIEIKVNASNTHGVNLFMDGTFSLALMNGKDVGTAYAFDYLTNAEKEGHEGITVNGANYEAVYYKNNNTLEVYVVNYKDGFADSYNKTIYGGKK